MDTISELHNGYINVLEQKYELFRVLLKLYYSVNLCVPADLISNSPRLRAAQDDAKALIDNLTVGE